MRITYSIFGFIILLAVTAAFWTGDGSKKKTKTEADSFATQSQQIASSSNTNAFNFCSAIDSMGDATEPCRVSGRTVVIVLPMSATEAKKFCLGAANEMHKVGAVFEPGWTVQIKSPYSNGNTIAYCDL